MAQYDPIFNFSSVGNANDPYGYATRTAQQQIGNWGQIGKYGILGESGINRLSGIGDQEAALNRRKMQALIRARLARRLGARAGGAGEVAFQNQVIAPGFADSLAYRRSMIQRNLESRMSGLAGQSGPLQGLFSILNQEQDKPGVLDWVKPLIELGASIYSGHPGGAVAAVASAPKIQN